MTLNHSTYAAQLDWQEWVTVIEGSSAASGKIELYVIFKEQNLVLTWFPKELPPG